VKSSPGEYKDLVDDWEKKKVGVSDLLVLSIECGITGSSVGIYSTLKC